MWWLPVAAVLTSIGTHRSTRQWWASRSIARFGDGGSRRATERIRSSIRRPLGSASEPSDDVAPALDALARSLAGGTGLARALDSLIDRRNESTRPFVMALGVARRRHRLGVPLAAAFADARSTMAPTPETDLALTALEAAARHGGAQAGALDRAAFAVRQRRTVVAERAAHSAQARLSALVLSLLPPAFAMWSISTNHRVARFLLASPAGWLCTVGGVALNALGWRWMRRLVRSDE